MIDLMILLIMKEYKKKKYWVDFYTSGGHCYKSVYDVTYDNVLRFKKLAKLLGETIKYEEF